MGLYSVNRATVLESGNTLDFVAPDPSFGSLMETVIQIHENDNKMFESLIECDFISAHNEAYLTEEEASEANKKNSKITFENIRKKLSQFLEAIKAAIVKACSNLSVKIEQLITNDEKLVEKYKKTLTVENLKNFEGIKNFAFPTDESDMIKNTGYSAAEIAGREVSVLNKIKLDASREEIDAVKAEMENFIKDMNEAADKNSYFRDPVDNWKPTDQDIKNMVAVLSAGGANVKKDIKNQLNTCIKNVESVKKSANNILKSKKDYSEDEVYVAKAVYDICSMYSKFITKGLHRKLHDMSRQIAAYRKAFIICGRAAAKAAGVEEPERVEGEVVESAIEYVLGEMSDQYVFDSLSY